MKTAICITTFNRPEILLRGLVEQWKFLPKNAKIFVVDDGSTEKADMSGFPAIEYFELPQNRGIAAAKNKCLELADAWGADHIFLFDSDTWPKRSGWELPYIKSKEPHLMYIFTEYADILAKGHKLSECAEIYRDKKLVAYNHVRGVMLYVERRVLDVVGGFDERYGKGMYEHSDWSNRIHNSGLTSFRVMDVPDSQKLIHSMDEYREVDSSMSAEERSVGIRVNRPRHALSLTSKEFCEYRTTLRGTRDIIMTHYYTSAPDYQRKNANWKTDQSAIQDLQKSVESHGVEMVLLHDCFNLPNKVECTMDPYWNRYLRAYEYLRDNPDVRRVFTVDATDVKMINNPFTSGQMDFGKIYVGDEPEILGCRWIKERSWISPFRLFVAENHQKPLLNAGIIGGSREDVMLALHDMLTVYADSMMKVNDMVAFNYVLRTRYAEKIVHGTELVNNRFKSFEPTKEGKEWFMHK
jgi:glycosyltransferase involved in cell wall biosynthesis